MSTTFRHPFLLSQFGPYCWCMNCGKAHSTEKWVASDWQCPGCKGSALYAWRWEEIQASNKDYPPAPEEGKVYFFFRLTPNEPPPDKPDSSG